MPIPVACQCGAKFNAKDELAGKAVRCPKCKNPLKIPAPQAAPAASSAMDDLFDEVGITQKQGAVCPKCGEELRANAVLCVACGFNIETGERTEGVKISDQLGGHEASAEAVLERASRQIEIDKVEEKKNKSSGAPAYVYIFLLGSLAAFAGMMFTLPKGMAFFYTGTGLVVFGGLIQSYWGIRIIIAAFMESAAQGLLYLFVPLYPIFYWITRWKSVGGFFINALKAVGIQVLGGLFMGLGMVLPWTLESDDDESWLPPGDGVEVVQVDAEQLPYPTLRTEPLQAKLHA